MIRKSPFMSANLVPFKYQEETIMTTDTTPCPWETRELGADAEYAQAVSDEQTQGLDAALGLKMISLRLPEEMINAYKLIASHHGVGYQPLMRDILQRFVKEGLIEVMKAQSQKSEEADLRIQEARQKTA